MSSGISMLDLCCSCDGPVRCQAGRIRLSEVSVGNAGAIVITVSRESLVSRGVQGSENLNAD